MMAIKCIVSGNVQGVWFRDTTRRRALELGLTGRAVNLRSGSVEVIACGDSESVNELKEWLWQGSKKARVSSVQCEITEEVISTGFTIG